MDHVNTIIVTEKKEMGFMDEKNRLTSLDVDDDFEQKFEDIVNNVCNDTNGSDTSSNSSSSGSQPDQSFTQFLIESCTLAETIADRNAKRQCFKNIQQLCSRTKENLLKSDMTPANIHSQGIPWVIKDFIFIFIRLVNCWTLLNGYYRLANNSNNLWQIDRALNRNFLGVFQQWQFFTKDLAKQLVNIFSFLNAK